ncbi:GDSL esterase/lipase At5g33370, partial [Linum perenne]
GYQIGLGYILPYLSPDLKGELLLRGASFASAGIGILNATGVQRGYLIRMYQQFLYYEEYRRRVVALIGEEETDYFIQSALCYIALGDDDILSYYYDYYLNDDDDLDLSSPDSRRQFDRRSTKFVGLIVFEFKKYLIRLYELGFRRILVKGSGPVGCYPKVLAAGKRSKKKRSGKDDDECDEELQSVAASFNSRLGQVTTQLNSDVGYQAFIFINAFDSGTDIIANPRSYALIVAAVAVTTWSLAAKVEAGAGGRRAILGFGDSECDTGNNNYLATTYRADSPPYGIDFYPTRRPTGRFSNGRILIDSISLRIGLGYILPYLSSQLKGEWLLRGASFASAGIGILNATGVRRGNLIRMYQQFFYFEQYRRRVASLIGEEETQYFIEGSLFIVSLGGGDFLNYYNYIDDDDDDGGRRSSDDDDDSGGLVGLPDKYITLLLSEYKKYLIKMYELGARRVLVRGTGPVGCYPKVLAAKKSKNKDECDDELQNAVASFNARLFQMTTQMNSEFGYDVFISFNSFALFTDFIANPRAYGKKLRNYVSLVTHCVHLCVENR